MFLIFGSGEDRMDTLRREAPGTNPKFFFLKGKVTKRKREKALYVRKYESQLGSSFYSKILIEHQIIQSLGRKLTPYSN